MKHVRVVAFLGLSALLGVSFGAPAEAAQTGKASYYRHGSRTASGERFNPRDYTAAHRTLPFGTRVLVTNLNNGKSVIVRINDRGPHTKGRIIDLSLGAAQVVGITAAGVAQVKIVPLARVEQVSAAIAAPAPAAIAADAAPPVSEAISFR